MSLNLGSINVGMNVDLAEFQAGMAKATALANSNAALMSAGMRTSSREAAESVRLIDEAIGVHISRPLARVIAQLPGFSAAFSALGGIAGVAGIAALIGVGFERLAPLIENVAKHYGLVSASAEETARAITDSDKQVIDGLKRKAELQDAYNKLVLGLTGGDYEAGHLKILREESAELQKQLQLSIQQATTSIVGQTSWHGTFRQWQELFSTLPGMGKLAPGLDTDKIDEAKKALEPLKQALQQIQDAIKVAGWTEYRDQVDAAAETQKKASENLAAFNELMFKQKMYAGELVKEYNDLVAAIGKLPTARHQAPSAPGGTVAPPSVSPTSADQTQLAKIQTDQTAAWEDAQKVIDSIEPPMERYLTTQQRLKTILADGYLTQQQYNAAMGQAATAYAEASNHLTEMQKALEKALKQTDSVRAGFAAFYLQLQIDAQQKGAFTFQELTKAMEGFDDNMAKILTGQKSSWHSFFLSLEEDLIKFAEHQAWSLLLRELASLGGGGGFFGNLFGAFGGGHAAGGDLTPGYTYIVGEQGPEPLTVDPSGRGFVSPNSSLLSAGRGGAGGDIYIDARGADASVEARMLNAMRAAHDSAVARSVTYSSELAKRTLS